LTRKSRCAILAAEVNMSNDEVVNYEIEIETELYNSLLAICQEQELDIKTELRTCVEEYISSIQAEIEG